MKTFRVPCFEIMSLEEKKGFCQVVAQFEWLYDPILRSIEAYTKNSHSLLDVGCGDGTLLRKIKKQFPHLAYIGVDVDPFFIQCAQRKNFCEYKIESAEKLHSTADIVLSNLSFHHFKNPMLALAKITLSAQKVAIISDQIRPSTENELRLRLKNRTAFLRGKFGNDYKPPFYDNKHERASILESYSKEEILEFAKQFHPKITFFDNDYYERFVWEIKKT